jgi:hypothetical protein
MFGLVISPSEVASALLGALTLYGVVSFFLRRKSDDSDVNWSPFEAVGVTVAIFFGTQLVIGLIALLIGAAKGLTADQVNSILDSSAGWQFAMVLSIESMTAWLVYVFLKRRKTLLSAIGVVRPQLRDVWYAIGGFFIYFGVYALFIFNIISHFFPQLDVDQKQELGFNTGTTGPELIFVFLSLVILPPLVEELLVRGFLYTGLRTKLPIITAAVLTSLAFAAAHLQWGSGNSLLWTAAADTFTLSLVLIWLRQKTGSLWPGIGVHFIKNGLAFIALFILKVS